jgi:signal transduction histidine kinase
VRISAEPESLQIEVASRPAVGVSAEARVTPVGAGTGLVGLTERVALTGGELAFGPNDSGDFVLRASLPRQR